jgi:uncharacterized damage-inducible protein DinB
MLALYNLWANERLYAAAAQLTPEALAEDRGAFFGSLLGTLNHLLVTDRAFRRRLKNADCPPQESAYDLGHRSYRGIAIIGGDRWPIRL